VTTRDSVRLYFDGSLYDEAAVRQTTEQFRSVSRVTVRRAGDGLSVTLTPLAGAVEDIDTIAGELANIALARTLEARQG
jgi:hypothetical protein